MKTKAAVLISAILFFASCNQQASNNTAKSDNLVLRFEIDSNENITDAKVKAQVVALAKELQKSADKMVMNAYTEQSGNPEQDEKTAQIMARAVRELMKTQGERNATNIAVYIKGFQNPIDSVNPANRVNRRIEIVPMQ